MKNAQQRAALIWSDSYSKYELGEGHPMNRKRLLVPYHLFKNLNLFNHPNISIIDPQPAPESALLSFHTENYVRAIKTLAETGGARFRLGLGTEDCPVFPEMHEISRFTVGGTLEGIRVIQDQTNDIQQAFSLLGGFHHAFAEKAAGFCYYNDVAIAIKQLQQNYGLERILYIDTDVHAGDGVLDAFYDEKGVLGISFHESPQFIFPGTGFSNEIGEDQGLGYTINLPIFPGTWDDLYIEMFECIVPCLWEQYDPEFVIWQCGADGHCRDILGHLNLTTKAYNHLGKRIAQLSHQSSAQGKLLMLGGGGYNPDSVARVWLVSFAAAMGIDLPVESPQKWQDICSQQFNLIVSSEIQDTPIDLKNVDRPDVIKAANNQYLIALEEEIRETGVWDGCVDLLKNAEIMTN